MLQLLNWEKDKDVYYHHFYSTLYWQSQAVQNDRKILKGSKQKVLSNVPKKVTSTIKQVQQGQYANSIVLPYTQFSSAAQLCPTLGPHGLQHTRLPCPSPTPRACSNTCPSRRLMQSNHLILCRPLPLPPSSFPSIRVFSNESALRIRWPKYWIFSFSISPSNEYSGLISFRMDWLDLLVVQGTLKSLLQHHNSKASVLWHSAFFIVQLSHPYMTTGKTIALPRQTFVSKVVSLFFNMLSRLVIAFLPRSKRILTSWLQSPSALIHSPLSLSCRGYNCRQLFRHK